MTLKKAIYIGLGCVGVGLGAIGAVVPLLPTVPFFMLAALCFGKSSERLHKWFLSTDLYKNNLSLLFNRKGLTAKTKLRIVAAVTVTMIVGFLLMGRVPVGRFIILAVWLFHLGYFVFGIKTIRAPK